MAGYQWDSSKSFGENFVASLKNTASEIKSTFSGGGGGSDDKPSPAPVVSSSNDDLSLIPL